MTQALPTASSCKTIGHIFPQNSSLNVSWTPSCDNGSVGWVVKRELAGSLGVMRMLAERVANPPGNVKDYFTVE